jgi:hypothetical protein
MTTNNLPAELDPDKSWGLIFAEIVAFQDYMASVTSMLPHDEGIYANLIHAEWLVKIAQGEAKAHELKDFVRYEMEKRTTYGIRW